MFTKKQQNNKESLQRLKRIQPHKFCLVHINKTKNNIHCAISSIFGKQKTLWSVSGGQVGSARLNSRRKTRYVQRIVYKATIEKMFGLGLQYVILQCKGTIPSKRYFFKIFNEFFTILLVKDLTNVAHNGTKPRNKRRI